VCLWIVRCADYKFEGLTCLTKELVGLLLFWICSAVCVYGLCVVQITNLRG